MKKIESSGIGATGQVQEIAGKFANLRMQNEDRLKRLLHDPNPNIKMLTTELNTLNFELNDLFTENVIKKSHFLF